MVSEEQGWHIPGRAFALIRTWTKAVLWCRTLQRTGRRTIRGRGASSKALQCSLCSSSIPWTSLPVLLIRHAQAPANAHNRPTDEFELL